MGRTPAEERAAREGMPVVLMLPAELVNVAMGHPTVTSTADGREVLVRLPSAEEFMAKNRAAVETLRAQGLQTPDPVSRWRAEELVRPIGGDRG